MGISSARAVVRGRSGVQEQYAPSANLSPDGPVAMPKKPQLSLYQPQEWPEVLSPGEVAQLFRMAQTTISRWCETGEIEAVKFGRAWRIPRDAVWPRVPQSIRATWPDGPWKRQDDQKPEETEGQTDRE